MTVKKKVLADGSRVCRPTIYANREDLPNTPEATAVVVGLHYCMAAPEASEYSTSFPDLTGRYEGDGAVMCINQAGVHLRTWLSSPPLTEGANRPVYRYAGDFDPETGHFELEGVDHDGTGFLAIAERDTSSPTIRVTFDDGSEHRMVRLSSRATWSDRVIGVWRDARLDGAHEIMRGVIELEHAPLMTWQIELLNEAILGAQTSTLLAALFRERAEDLDGAAVREHLEHLASHFNDLGFPTARLDKKPKGPRIFEDDRQRTRALARQTLLRSKLTLMGPGGAQEEYTRYEWFQRVLHYDRHYSIAPLGLPLKTWFGVEPSGRFRYKLTFKGWGYGLSAGVPFADRIKKKAKEITKNLPGASDWVSDKILGKLESIIGVSAGGKRLTGTLTIESLQPAGWKRDYIVDYAYGAVGQGGGGVDWKKTLEATGWCETDIEWLPQDFHGDLTNFSGQFARWDGELQKKQFIWNLVGSGTDRGTQLIFDKVKSEFGGDFLGLGWGTVFGHEDEIRPPDDKKRFKELQHTIEYEESTDFDFELGSATVREEGRRKLRAFAAKELAEIRDGETMLEIRAFADRIDRRWYNKVLSENRASNTHTALKDCLTDSLAAQVDTFGAGEDALALLNQHLDFPDDQAAPEWRRVFVTLNGQVTIALKVRDLNPPRGGSS